MNKLLFYLFIAIFVTLFSCTKEYSLEKGINALPAEGSLWDSSGECLPSTVYGTFYNGIPPGSDTAYVEIQVNVTQTGSYNIGTLPQNGFSFADSGFFGSTGINIIRLKPIGTPIIPTTATFTVSFDSTACSFIVDVQDSTGTGLGGGTDTTGNGDPDGSAGSWQFQTDQGLFTTGTLDTVLLAPNPVFGGSVLFMNGFTPTDDSAFTLYVLFPGNTIEPGTYYTQKQGSETFAKSLFAFNFVSSGDPIYDALDNPGDGSQVGITITSYDASTKIVTGTFAGIAVDEQNAPALINIQEGSFTATVSQ